jgi:uncharacterized protein (TIGR03437 family)
MTIYVTGAGSMQPPVPDGQVAITANSKPALGVSVYFSGVSAEVLYTGSAPGIVAGVLQINVRVPNVLCNGFPDCFINPDAIQVYLGLGEPEPGTYFFGKYFSQVLATVAVK